MRSSSWWTSGRGLAYHARSQYNQAHAIHQPWAVDDKPMITKRKLGILFILAGLAGAGALLAVDLLGAGAFQGIGPAQRKGLLIAAGLVGLGLTLLPLGNRPA